MRPVHELVQAAEGGDPLGSGSEHQVIGVREHDIAPSARTASGCIALTVAAVPTGMKAGVLIAPRGVEIDPTRAAPSTARTAKLKVEVIEALERRAARQARVH